MRLDLGAFRVLSRRDFWKDLWHEINKDDCWGLAAQLSFYFLLAFFPFLIFVSALITLIPSDPNLLAKILAELHPFLPDRTFVTVHRIVMRLVMAEDSPGALSLGIALALWPASLGFSGMVGMLNRAYVLQETRSYLSIRALAIAVTVVVSLLVVLSGILIFTGDALLNLALFRVDLSSYPSLESLLRVLYSLIRWFLIFGLLNLGIQIVYFALPDQRSPWKLLSPGSAAASAGWIVGSKCFSLYANHLVNYQVFYGSLGALVALMVWFYVSSLFLLIGVEIDSEIHRLRYRRH